MGLCVVLLFCSCIYFYVFLFVLFVAFVSCVCSLFVVGVVVFRCCFVVLVTFSCLFKQMGLFKVLCSEKQHTQHITTT